IQRFNSLVVGRFNHSTNPMAGNWTDRRVVITGLGVVSPLGNDINSLWKGIVAAKCGVERITHFDPSSFDTQIAAEVRNFNAANSFPSPKEARRADRFTQFGINAGHQALIDSGLDLEKAN